ncbi:hypothetical protein B9Z55_010631 [Caenorhabditis nigoni]|uniref:Uncharacterized protein n=1 Tax=Caenorhabditis nigoni TaxID=1611254 RepID=A0A2G5UGP3_9PELO|nr:hypothetical protein B9Z55_010631 [Caenorhabditis nigoni]
MITPEKPKRSRLQQQPGTPIPTSRRREDLVNIPAVYNPPVSKLKKNYDLEFGRFLRSAKIVLDFSGYHDLPDELLSFVTQQLMEWRELFKDVEWLKRFRETSKKVEAYQQKCQEQADRLMILNEIGSEFEACNLNYHNFNKNDKNIVDSITSAILDMRITRKPLDGLKHVPMLSKRISVKRWYQKHYDPLSQTESDNESDDDGSSDSENSSLRNGAANSNADDAADISSDEAENDNDFDAFFND